CGVFSSRRRHTRAKRDWSSDVCSSDLVAQFLLSAFLKSEHLQHQSFYHSKHLFDKFEGFALSSDYPNLDETILTRYGLTLLLLILFLFLFFYPTTLAEKQNACVVSFRHYDQHQQARFLPHNVLIKNHTFPQKTVFESLQVLHLILPVM